ncbi:hypothetical protein Hanom_Chr03g00206111 [Helianthus anomalus]
MLYTRSLQDLNNTYKRGSPLKVLSRHNNTHKHEDLIFILSLSRSLLRAHTHTLNTQPPSQIQTPTHINSLPNNPPDLWSMIDRRHRAGDGLTAPLFSGDSPTTTPPLELPAGHHHFGGGGLELRQPHHHRRRRCGGSCQTTKKDRAEERETGMRREREKEIRVGERESDGDEERRRCSRRRQWRRGGGPSGPTSIPISNPAGSTSDLFRLWFSFGWVRVWFDPDTGDDIEDDYVQDEHQISLVHLRFLYGLFSFCGSGQHQIHVRFSSTAECSVRVRSSQGSVNSQTWSNLVKDRFDWFGSTEINGSARVKRLGQTQFRIWLTRSSRVNSVNWSTQFGSVNASQTQLTNGTKNGKNL